MQVHTIKYLWYVYILEWILMLLDCDVQVKITLLQLFFKMFARFFYDSNEKSHTELFKQTNTKINLLKVNIWHQGLRTFASMVFNKFSRRKTKLKQTQSKWFNFEKRGEIIIPTDPNYDNVFLNFETISNNIYNRYTYLVYKHTVINGGHVLNIKLQKHCKVYK